jgi:arylsulfatase A-like enzyme
MRVAFVVKQPRRALAGQRVGAVVQLADLVPTILDLVRAPLPGGFYGRSLAAVLDDAEGVLPVASRSTPNRSPATTGFGTGSGLSVHDRDSDN